MKPEIKKVSWEEAEKCSRKIAKWADGQKFTEILAISKGGLFPGLIVANVLEIPLEVVKAQRKVGCSIASMLYRVRYPEYSFFLVVDDIIDEGITMIEIARMLKEQGAKFKTVSMYWKFHSRYKPDFYVKEVKSHYLVVFPWESEKNEIRKWEEWNERYPE